MRTVGEAMITDVKLGDSGTTVSEVRGLFTNEHVHSAVLVDNGVLTAVVDRADVQGEQPEHLPAATVGSRYARTISPNTDLDAARQFMLATGRRRLAVVDSDGTFRGLLCLKRTRRGFCSDHDLKSRMEDDARPLP